MVGKGNLMNCSDISTLSPLYLAGELETARAREFSTHLAACPECNRELVRQKEIDALLRRDILAEPIDASVIDKRLMQQIHRAHGRSPRRLAVALAIAALLFLAVAGYRSILSKRMNTTQAAAARDHRIEIVNGQPRKWITKASAIENLAASQGLPGAAIAGFIPAGYHLAQGRLCFLNGRVFVHLVYANPTENFSLYVRKPIGRAAAELGTPARANDFGTEHVAGFEKSYLTAVVVSEHSDSDAMRLANSFAAAI
jgi:anti-sigma factor RsiW